MIIRCTMVDDVNSHDHAMINGVILIYILVYYAGEMIHTHS